jgi:hypothetical protein
LTALELGVAGEFARGCHDGGITHFALLSAAGSNANSRIRYARIMGCAFIYGFVILTDSPEAGCRPTARCWGSRRRWSISEDLPRADSES